MLRDAIVAMVLPCHEDQPCHMEGWEVREVVIQRFFLCSDIRLSTFRSEPMASIYRYQISHDIHIRIFTCIYIGFRALLSSDSLKVDVNTALLVAQRHHVAERFAELTLAAHFEQLEDPNDTKALASRLEAMVVCCFCLDDLLIL